MARIKSAKKQARQSIKRNAINTARRSDIKTAVKKVFTALQNGEAAETVRELMRSAESKIARAKNKVFHKNAASRKVGRLAKKVSAYTHSA
jgi:small subunit ribosomal protein S20